MKIGDDVRVISDICAAGEIGKVVDVRCSAAASDLYDVKFGAPRDCHQNHMIYEEFHYFRDELELLNL